MKKQKKSAKSTQKPFRAYVTRKRLLVGGAILLVCVALIAQLIFDAYVYMRATRYTADDVGITELITQAVHNLQKPTVTDPQGRQYMPDAKLVLPPAEAPYDQLRYNFTSDGSKSWMQITTRQAIDTSTAKLWSARAAPNWYGQSEHIRKIFDQVPALQACARGVTATFDAESAAIYPEGSVAMVHLADGRTLYMSLYDSKQCDTNLSGLLTLLQQAKSY